MKRYISYIEYLFLHKWYVLIAGIRLRVPLWQLIIHDWSKFRPAEFFPYAKHFYNVDGSKRTNGKYLDNMSSSFQEAWVRHQHKNLHHWQAWLSIGSSLKPKAVEIPKRYAKEMVADWIGAGKAISGNWSNIHSWYNDNKDKMLLYPETRSFVEQEIKASLSFTSV